MSQTIERYRADTYPEEVTLTRDGTWSLSGSTVTMTFTFDDGDTYSFTGTITDTDNKVVEFEPTVTSVAAVRDGVYDIQVDDGTYRTTHAKGALRITDDVTKT